MVKKCFLPEVLDIRKLFTEYREKLEQVLLESYLIETKVVNRVVELQRLLHQISTDIEDGKVQDIK